MTTYEVDYVPCTRTTASLTDLSVAGMEMTRILTISTLHCRIGSRSSLRLWDKHIHNIQLHMCTDDSLWTLN